ncbi:uncharacterized protein LOC131150275 [Malania oleifera]|uniref:uncharacterized protein LOC131150275 n=1 Tax=Malania oleifera TaxID=397392 RepID=UPI0025AEA2DD|nr:uncharacterized protein LOC131150275 [Malania oleifera]
MFCNHLCKTLINARIVNRFSASQLYNLQSPLLFIRPTSSNATNQHSFTVSYLINTCGFSPEAALSASKYVHFDAPDKPNSVIAFFEKQGFSRNQVLTLLRIAPRLILYRPEKTLLPKFNFLFSIGFSRSGLAKAMTSCPRVLERSLENQIVPCFNFLRDLFQSHEKTITALKRYPGMLGHDFEKKLGPNFAILREQGVPESNFADLLTVVRRAIVMRTDVFREAVQKVCKMGLDPSRKKFVLAVSIMMSMSRRKWERKMEVYRNWGWSDEDVLVAFCKYPWCMAASEEKIRAVMDFFVNTMGWESSLIARNPTVIVLSLEKTIVPRSLVVQILLSEGLIKKRFSLNSLLKSSEELFLKRFVRCYENEAPQLLTLYQEKLNCSPLVNGKNTVIKHL